MMRVIQGRPIADVERDRAAAGSEFIATERMRRSASGEGRIPFFINFETTLDKDWAGRLGVKL